MNKTLEELRAKRKALLREDAKIQKEMEQLERLEKFSKRFDIPQELLEEEDLNFNEYSTSLEWFIKELVDDASPKRIMQYIDINKVLEEYNKDFVEGKTKYILSKDKTEIVGVSWCKE